MYQRKDLLGVDSRNIIFITLDILYKLHHYLYIRKQMMNNKSLMQDKMKIKICCPNGEG